LRSALFRDPKFRDPNYLFVIHLFLGFETLSLVFLSTSLVFFAHRVPLREKQGNHTGFSFRSRDCPGVKITDEHDEKIHGNKKQSTTTT
jgi:hypothetical protein